MMLEMVMSCCARARAHQQTCARCGNANGLTSTYTGPGLTFLVMLSVRLSTIMESGRLSGGPEQKASWTAGPGHICLLCSSLGMVLG